MQILLKKLILNINNLTILLTMSDKNSLLINKKELKTETIKIGKLKPEYAVKMLKSFDEE